MIKSFIEYFRSYNDEVLVPYWNWVDKHKFAYYVVGPIIDIGIAVMLFLYLTRDDNKKLEINDYDDEEES